MPEVPLVLQYLPGLEINQAHADLFPNNCSVRERTADGTPVGACWFYLEGGVKCPRHGVVKIPKTNNA